MSRTDHTLRSREWRGDWATLMHRDNREARRRARERRDGDRVRVDARQLTLADTLTEADAVCIEDRLEAIDDGACSCFAFCSCECACGAWAGDECTCGPW